MIDIEDVETGKITVCVVGLGYVGLPSAIEFHTKGFSVRGVDTSEKKVSLIKGGINPLDAISVERVPEEGGRWKVSSEMDHMIDGADVAIIAVPTPVSDEGGPDLSFLKEAIFSTMSSEKRKKGLVIVVESTVYPGATRSIIEKSAKDLNLKEDTDFFVAYCPERVNPGDPEHTVSKVPRVLGCDNAELGLTLSSLYSIITEGGCSYVGRIEVAEAAKLIENVQRDADIALVNELALVLPMIGLDVEEVLDAAGSKWNFHRHTPGIGVGGHCIPVDPHYYISLASELGVEQTISSMARKTNEMMPDHVCSQLCKITENGSIYGKTVLIIGFAYKPGLGDIRNTPAIPLMEKLTELGAEVIIWDPHVESSSLGFADKFVDDLDSLSFDIALLATAHNECLELDWGKLRENCTSGIFYDGRRAMEKTRMQDIGWKYHGVGFPIQ